HLHYRCRAMRAFSDDLLYESSSHLPTEVQDLLDRVISNTQRMKQLVEDLLLFSRLNRQPLSRQSVELLPIVRELLDQLRREHNHQHLDIHLGDLPDCIGDRSLLTQVFANLLPTPFKFTPRKQS